MGFRRKLSSRTREAEGVWVAFPEYESDCGKIPELKIARMAKNNPRYLKAYDLHFKTAKRALRRKSVTVEDASRANLLVFVDAGLLDWKDLANSDTDGKELVAGQGKFLEYTKEHARIFFEEHNDFLVQAIDYAEDEETFVAEELEDEAKNSAKSLSSTSSGESFES